MKRDDFNAMTDTGKFQAVTDAQERAEKAEEKLQNVGRYLFGALLLVMHPDEIIARIMKRAERRDAKDC